MAAGRCRFSDEILEQYKVVQHGVSMYFGSAEKPNREHLRRLKELVKRTKTPWVSDHLCWGSVDGRYTHDLLPMPYTFEAAKITAQKVREVRDFLEVPMAVENVSSYAEFHVSEMTEWEFLNEVVERADCGILLDVNNIYVSSQNHNFDPLTYVNSVPGGARGADSHRGTLEVSQIHSGHPRSSGDRSGLEAVRARDSSRRAHRDLVGVGRQYSVVPGSSRRSAESQQAFYRPAAGDRRMKLLKLQRTMARAVMQPLTSTERMQRKAPDGRSMRSYAARFIKPNDRLTSFERLEIYNRQYWFRLLSSMMEDFPGLRCGAWGDTRSRPMCKAYLVDCPSRSFTLRNLGAQDWKCWLRKHPKWAGRSSAGPGYRAAGMGGHRGIRRKSGAPLLRRRS